MHSFGLGFILHLQGTTGWWTKKYIERGETKQTAFENWKRYFACFCCHSSFVRLFLFSLYSQFNSIYNLSLVMNHVAFVCCFLKFAEVSIWDFIGRFFFKQALAVVCSPLLPSLFPYPLFCSQIFTAPYIDQRMEFYVYFRGPGRVRLVLR